MENREEEPNADIHPAFPPAADDVQRVDAERIDGTRTGPGPGPAASGEANYRFGTYANQEMPDGSRIHVFHAETNLGAGNALLKPPTLATWICLAIAWLFLGSKVPFTVFLGIPFDLAALLLATVCLTRGGILTGLSVLALGTVGSLFVYIVGLFRFLAMA